MDNLREVMLAYRIPLFLGGGSIVVIFVSLILLVKSTQTTTTIQFSSDQTILGDSTQSTSSANPQAGGQKAIHVDVEGGVRAPGVYILPVSSRIIDAIDKAGGLTEEADMEVVARQLNRASILTDGAKIYVPKKEDEKSYNIDTTFMSHINSSQNININTASENELESLSGVGPVTAKKIIDNRPYQTLEQLVSKKSLGKALFEKIKGNLSL